MAIQDTEIVEWAKIDYPEGDYQIFDLENADDDGNASCPVVERVTDGAWVLARVWVGIDWAETPV